LDAKIWLDEKKLLADGNQSLNEPFSQEEVKIALDNMVKNKAPGPDGIPVVFYQAC
jgi:hypothetical protein